MHYRKALRPLLVAVILSMVAPATILAADATRPTTTVASGTAEDVNLLDNPGFETIPVDSTIPSWTKSGKVHVETFGTKSWPSQSYGTKWSGGHRYLTCGKNSGLVRQTVAWDWGTRSYPLKARLLSDFGGVTGAKIRAAIHFTGASDVDLGYREAVRVLDITHHYLRIAVTFKVPALATHIEATIELIRKDGDTKCRMVADQVNLTVFQP